MQLGSTISPLALLCCLFLLLLLVAMETADARASASGSGNGGGSKRCRGKRRNSRRCRKAALTQGHSGVRALQDGPGKDDDPLQGHSVVKVVNKSRRKGGKGKGKEKSPPEWHKQPPKDKLFIQRDGSEAVFKCKAVGQPRPKVTWFKDGAVVKVKKNKKFRKSKWKLQVSQVTIGDSGNYTCRVVNTEGSLQWTYTLRVLEMKPISDINIIERPKNQTAHVGDTVLFRCRSDTWPAPSMYWARKLNDKLVVEIIPRDNNTLAEDLVIDNVSKADAGEYTCYIGNNISNLRLSAILTVIEEGESLPFEPKCALHVRRQIYVDSTYGCQTAQPVEMNYCMGSCGRSYYIPVMMATDEVSSQLAQPLNQTCQCCVGQVQGIRIVPLRCPSGEPRNGFFPFFSDCACSPCSVKDAFSSGGQSLQSSPVPKP